MRNAVLMGSPTVDRRRSGRSHLVRVTQSKPASRGRDRATPHPCPSTGKTSDACPGYRKDHIVPLGCGGPDAVSNLQWQTIFAANAKDRWEVRACGR